MRYREFLVLNIWVVWDKESFSYWTFGFCEIQGVFWPAKDLLLGSHEGLRCVHVQLVALTVPWIASPKAESILKWGRQFFQRFQTFAAAVREQNHSLYYVRFVCLLFWYCEYCWQELLKRTRTGAPVCVVPVFQRLRRCIVALLVGHKTKLIFIPISSFWRGIRMEQGVTVFFWHMYWSGIWREVHMRRTGTLTIIRTET
jgi:hypothetical protein